MILHEEDFAREGAIVHYTTKNTSFLRMAVLLREMGIRNNKFFLALYDQNLLGVDPHHLTEEQNTLEMRLRIANECKINPWYYIREVVRVPAQGAENLQFELNRANLSLCWAFFSNIDMFLTIPRQIGKTIGVQTIQSYMLYVRGMNITMGLFTKDSKLQLENVARLKSIRDALPPYLINPTTSDVDNKEGIAYAVLGTKYKTYIASGDRAAAEKQARGETFAYIHWDEIAYYINIERSYDPVSFTTSTGKEQAHKVGLPCANIITTTAGRLRSPSGRFAYKIKAECLPFTERLYDLPTTADIIKLMPSRKMIYIEYSYKQLGKTQAWFEERAAGKSPDIVATDLLNQWLNDAGDSPIDDATLKKLNANMIEPLVVTFEDSIMLRWYVHPEKMKEVSFYQKPLIIGMDLSDNAGRDYTTFVLMDPTDMSVVAVFRCNTTNLTFVTRYIIKLLKSFPRSVFIPERNRNGGMLIDTIIVALKESGINPFKRIYNTIIQEYASTKNPIDINTTDPTHGAIRAHFGFVTSKSAMSRDLLYQTVLLKAMKHNVNRIYDSHIIDEISSLVIRNGRIDHAVEGNDDTAIAYLLACYFVFFGKELHRYGIRPDEFLSRIGDDGSDIDPMEKQKQRWYRQRKTELEEALNQGLSETMRLNYERQLEDIKQRIKPGIIEDDIISVAQLTTEARKERVSASSQSGVDLHQLMNDHKRQRVWF